MIGKTLIEEFNVDPRSKDPAKLYFQRWGAEFAAGFAYGVKIGDLDQDELYKCMEREPRAEATFYKASVELTRSIYDNNPKKGMKAMDDLFRFIADMATEHDGKDWSKKICPILTANEK